MRKKQTIQSDNILESVSNIPMSITRFGNDLILCDDLDREEDHDDDEIDFILSHIVKASNIFGIVVCLAGHIEIEWGCETFFLCAGDMTFLQSGSVGGLRSYSHDVRSMCILSHESFYKPQLTASDSASFCSEILLKPYCKLTDEGLQSVRSLYLQLKRVLEQQERIRYIQPIVLGLMQTITFLCLSIFHNSADVNGALKKTSNDADYYQRFLSLAQHHYNQHYDIKYYADKLCITPKYLSQLVCKASGLHAKEIIDNYRLNEAKLLLRSMRYNVNEVSEMLYFPSPSHFCRYFKRHTHLTPLQYQNNATIHSS